MWFLQRIVILLIFSILSLGNLQADTYSWDAGGNRYSWQDKNNWNFNIVPTSTDDARIEGSGYNVIIDIHTGFAECQNIYVPRDTSVGGTLNINSGGTLTITGTMYLGRYKNSGNGKININGGTLNCNNLNGIGTYVRGINQEFNLNSGTVNVTGNLIMGSYDDINDNTSILNINGGTLNVTGGISFGYVAGSGIHDANMTDGVIFGEFLRIPANFENESHFQFDGGTINILREDGLDIGDVGVGYMDMGNDSKLVLSGNSESKINRYIKSGKLTSTLYGEDAKFNIFYNGSTTTVTVTEKCSRDIAEDLNYDCQVDFKDFGIIANNWLETFYDDIADGTIAYLTPITDTTPQFRIVGYVSGSWKENYSKATCLNYSFLRLNYDATFQEFNGEKLESFVTAAHECGVKVLICVGGGDVGTGPATSLAFIKIAANTELRKTLIDNLVAFVNQYNLDGIDIDWEYPHEGDWMDNYVILMGELYDEFHPDGKLITTAITGNTASQYPVNYIPTCVFDSLDWVNIMTYGTIHEKLEYSYFSTGLTAWLDRGLPPEKAVMGIPLYGRDINTDEAIAYEDLVVLDVNAPYKDEVQGYVYNGFRTARRKTQLAIDNECGGVMFWHFTQDTTDYTSLLGAVYNKVLLNSIEYYSTQFDNFNSLAEWSGRAGWDNYWYLDLQLGEGQLVTSAGNQNTSVWYEGILSDGNSPYDLQDYIVTAEFDANSGATPVQLLARVTNSGNFYSCKYLPDHNLFALQAVCGGTNILYASQEVTELIPNIYTMRLLISENRLEAKIIDAIYGTVLAEIDAVDSHLSSGTAGFRVYNTTACINNFRIGKIISRVGKHVAGDINYDCKIDLEDIGTFSDNWLEH
jgi:hypothetical protein